MSDQPKGADVAARELNPPPHAGIGLRLSGIPVLLYHGIGTEERPGSTPRFAKYAVTPEQFSEHLRLIRTLGLRIISLSELLQRPQPELIRAVAITFDDGLFSDYTQALPFLQKASAVAHFFVNTANVGEEGRMGWSEILELQRAGMIIGSHGHRHVDHSQNSPEILVRQMSQSRQILEQRLRQDVTFFAAPYGLVSRNLYTAARRSGYSCVCTSHYWPARPGSQRVSRVAIYRHTSLKDLQSLLLGTPGPYLRGNLQAVVKFIPRQFLLRVWPSALGVDVLQERP
jgi:peptidoglycan/xylan/chitin deacetylase (PgdA/CDA1 family)